MVVVAVLMVVVVVGGLMHGGLLTISFILAALHALKGRPQT